MTRVVYYTATTLDGFLATPDDSLDWLFAVPGADAAEAQLPDALAGFGALVMGSTTYRWVLDHERLLERPEAWRGFYGDRPTWVFTSRELPAVPSAPIRFVQGAVAENWPAISESAGDRDVWLVGGGDLVGQFADAGHLDEVRLSIAPVTLGAGKPLLPRRLDATRLHLESVSHQGQFAELVYAVGPR